MAYTYYALYTSYPYQTIKEKYPGGLQPTQYMETGAAEKRYQDAIFWRSPSVRGSTVLWEWNTKDRQWQRRA